ncbi:DUF6286 domain-containing protein [Microbispora sp. ATCC PTA-5024]|uniref:DUF6286 domain-containing protein n=1 Tax=Microbispora sp. ATCC PTA-5024 TaxID=316330 RepID=UPI0003DBEEE2|nr:DUF6286 domain-containing protein [Microbispora sp. ATCC PTA-5024]ETK35496.1 hypothetical protein MPTA5024_13790 [Microbispora sp. ATCC PTA-5024]
MTHGPAPSEGPRFFVPSRRPESRGVARAFRPTRAGPAGIVALVLLALGVVTAVQVITTLLGNPVRIVPYDQVARWLRTTTWDGDRALAVASALALLGLLLLLIALVPGRGRMVTLATGDPDLAVGVPRRTLSAVLTAAASHVDGVRHARARVHGWRADVRADTDLRDTAGVGERVRAAVERELDRLAPAHAMSVRVRTHGPS